MAPEDPRQSESMMPSRKEGGHTMRESGRRALMGARRTAGEFDNTHKK